MSAYNLAQYNASKFNVNPSSDIWLNAIVKTTFSFSYAGITNYLKGNASVWFIPDQMSLDPGKFVGGSSQLTVSNQSLANSYFWQMTSSETVFTTEINLSQEAFAIGTVSTDFGAEMNLSQEAFVIGTDLITFDPAINCSQNAYATGTGGVEFSQTANVINLLESVCTFPNLILRPGQSLIIDSGSYNVMLNGQNAIHLQEGDWFDNLSRDTIDITVTATGVSRLQIQIIYIERYL